MYCRELVSTPKENEGGAIDLIQHNSRRQDKARHEKGKSQDLKYHKVWLTWMKKRIRTRKRQDKTKRQGEDKRQDETKTKGTNTEHIERT